MANNGLEIHFKPLLSKLYGAIAKWLRRQIRNLFLFEGAGSNPAGVARLFHLSFFVFFGSFFGFCFPLCGFSTSRPERSHPTVWVPEHFPQLLHVQKAIENTISDIDILSSNSLLFASRPSSSILLPRS